MEGFLTPKFKNKYRIPSTRLPNWDYSWPGWYFVTICTEERECFFRDVINGKMKLSEIGEIVKEEWLKTPKIRKNVKLDEWIIMPNHLHGVIIINNPTAVETPRRGVSTDVRINKKWKPNSLGSIINQIKSICTRRIRLTIYREFAWQSRFYDHIVRDEKDLNRIRKYIIENPCNWEKDRNNFENLYM